MAKEPTRSNAETARVWVQAVALPVVATLFTFLAFWYKEVLIPSTAPINLTAEVSVKQAGQSGASDSQGNTLEAIELVVTARNPSARTIYLLANNWMAWGSKVAALAEDDEANKDWLDRIPTDVNRKSYLVMYGRHAMRDQGTLVAMGNVFTDDLLHPNEKISATFVFYVPRGMFDIIQVSVDLPTASLENPSRHGTAAIANVYKLNADRQGVTRTIYRYKPDGELEPLPTDPIGDLLDKDKLYYGWQVAQAAVELSLWRSATPLATEAAPTP